MVARDTNKRLREQNDNNVEQTAQKSTTAPESRKSLESNESLAVVGSPKTCSSCKGSGSLRNGWLYWVCPICFGSGKVVTRW